MRRGGGARSGAQLCRTCARIGRDLGFAGRNRTFSQYLKAGRGLRHFRQMPRTRGDLAAVSQKILDDAVFQRMEGDDDEPSTRPQQALGGGKRLVQLVELFVDEDT